jgi:hypothetical protein
MSLLVDGATPVSNAWLLYYIPGVYLHLDIYSNIDTQHADYYLSVILMIVVIISTEWREDSIYKRPFQVNMKEFSSRLPK